MSQMRYDRVKFAAVIMEPINRDTLIDKVLRGELSPDDAEAEAVRLGLEKLASSPDPAHFDPMRETWWTLPMVVAWIAWRSVDRVRESWDAYRFECWDWHFREWRGGPDGPVHEGHLLEQRSSANLVWLSLAALYDAQQLNPQQLSMSISEARETLWKALGEGLLQATAITEEARDRHPIPPYRWRDLEAIEEHGRDVLRPRVETNFGWRMYYDVALDRNAVTALWPPRRPATACIALPQLVSPTGGGYMPLYCAAQWIATCGGMIDLDPSDETVWKDAYVQLLARLASEEVKVVGVRDGVTEQVSGFHFASCRIEYPFSEASIGLILGDELYLSSSPYIDDEHWRGGFDDALRNRRGDRWRRLMVLKSDVARWWPFSAAGATPNAAALLVHQTGAPGRPTSMHLVEAEYCARWDRGEARTSIGAEAHILSEWLRTKYPEVPRLKPKTIANRLREKHRERVAKAQK